MCLDWCNKWCSCFICSNCCRKKKEEKKAEDPKMAREKAVFMDSANDGDIENLQHIYESDSKDLNDKRMLLTTVNQRA